MKLGTISFAAAAMAAVLVGGSASTAPAAALQQPPQLTIDPIDIPATLQAQIDAAVAACGDCFSSVTPWQVIPIGAPADVFASWEIHEILLEQDVQLPWGLRGEVSSQALKVKLQPSGQHGVLDKISQFADPSGQGYRIGAYKWSYMTQPDYCSGETVYLMYFPNTGVLFAFRFDSSSEC